MLSLFQLNCSATPGWSWGLAILVKCLLKTKYDHCIMNKDVVQGSWTTVMAALGQSCGNLLADMHLKSFSSLTFGSQEGISSDYEPLMIEHLPCVQAEVLSLSGRRVGIWQVKQSILFGAIWVT